MYNVLSIDIDYAYSPSISAYDDYVEGSRISLGDQQKIFADLCLPEPVVNKEKLEAIKSVVTKTVRASTPVHIIDHHHDILAYLPENKELTIYNFDHHHDVFYPGWHTMDVLDEGNWVGHLQDHNVRDFYWIRNKDSEGRLDNIGLKFSWHEIYLPVIDEMPDFDVVVGCVSPHWTGENCREHLDYVLGGMHEF